MHLPELSGRENLFRVVAVCDTIAERRESAARRLGCPAYADLSALLADPQVELADIATRSCDHLAHGVAAMRAGKDVLIEKPMAATWTEARALRDEARRTGRRLFVRHNRRYEPAFNHVSAIMDSGVLGDVYEVQLRRLGYQRRDDWQTLMQFAGGQTLNWGPHIIDHALLLLGSPVASVWSDLRRVAAVGDAEDHVRIVLRGRAGRVVDLEISGGAALGEPVYLVRGTRGSLRSDEATIDMRYLDPEWPLQPRVADPGTPGAGGFGTADELRWIETSVPVAPPTQCEMDGIWDDLYAAIRQGREFPITLDQALRVMRIVDRAKRGTRYAR